MQHRSRPGQRRQQHFWGHVTDDQNIFKTKNSVIWLAYPGYVMGNVNFSDGRMVSQRPVQSMNLMSMERE